MSSIIHVHSMYSINDSTQTPEEIVVRAKELGFSNVTLTDHGTLLGIEPFMDAGKKYEINTVPGVEAYANNKTHLILFAKNYKGYQSICYAMRDANENMEIKKIGQSKSITYPIMSDEILQKHFKNNPDIIATTACIKGPIGDILLKNHKIKKSIKKDEDALDKNYQGFLDYQRYKKENTEKKRELSSQNKELKRLSGYLSAIQQEKINKLKTVIAETDSTAKKHQNAVSKLELYESQIKEANENLPDIEKTVKLYEEEVKRTKELYTENKKAYDKYKKVKEKLDSIKYYLEEDLYNEAKGRLEFLDSIFDNLYIELQYHGLEEEAYVMPKLVSLSKECNIKVIAANDAHINTNSEDCVEARRIVRYNYFDKAQETSKCDKELYIKTNDELSESLNKIIDKQIVEEAIKNTDILEECKVVFPDTTHYPSVDSDESFDDILEKERQRRISIGQWDDEHEQRLKHEVDVIKSMGYVDYHMVVRDFCFIGRKLGVIPKEYIDLAPYYDFNLVYKWINDKGFNLGVGIGPGRGSAVGSLVCNMLGITNIDPIKYNLLFERFLNPERVSMPDIDTDIASSIRPLLIKYLKWKYGEKAICSIGTELTYGAKNAILMAGRDRASQLYGESENGKELQKQYRYDKTLKISDLVPEEVGTKLADCDEIFKAGLDKNDEEVWLIIKRAKLLEGRLSGTSVHAGGVVISDNDNINEYLPLAWNNEKNVWATQCNMLKVEERGLLKMDLLGLNTLDCITDTIQMIKKYLNISINIDNIDFEDEVFLNIYSTGLTNSVFQFESDGMKNMLKDFKPTCFEDIILLVACYRPGPMQYLENIINIKNGKSKITYKTPMLEPILSTTYGATVYQEQVMQIFQSLAGYSLGGADLVRRAMSKKKLKALEVEREAFINGDSERNICGCINNGINEDIANTIFDEMIDFAKYAFNKSHATAYALVSYQTAWLKHHYTIYFLCAMFNNKPQDKYEPLIEDCNAFGIKLLPLDINCSYYNFVVEGNCIRYGFRGIKGIGEMNMAEIEKICHNREIEVYTGVKDFLIKNIDISENKDGMKYSVMRNKLLSILIDTGCFDSLGVSRQSIIIPEDMSYNSKNTLIKAIKSLTFSNEPIDLKYNMYHEIDLLGTIISQKPLENYKDDEYYNCTPINEVNDNDIYDIYGLVTESVERKSKKGNDLLILSIQGKMGDCSILAMNQYYTAYKDNALLYKVVKARISHSDKGNLVKELYLLDPIKAEYCIDLDTKEKTKIFSSVIGRKNDYEKNINVKVMCRWFGKDELYIAKRPRIVNRCLNQEDIDYLKEKGIDIINNK